MTPIKRRRFDSVRLRVTFWNVVALTAILILFGLGFRWALDKLLLQSLDDQMEGQVSTLAHRWAKLSEPRKKTLIFLLRVGPASQGMGGATDAGGEPGNSAALLLSGSAPEGVPSYASRLLDRKERDYLQSTALKPWDPTAYRRSLNGAISHRTVRMPSGDAVRICSYPIRNEAGSVEAVAQVARSLQPTTRMLQSIDRLLLLFLPIALLTSGVVGILLTGQALAPVGKLSATISRIGAADLSERLPIRGSDEFARLAEIVNEMLARLERAFEQQRRFTADASHELRSPLTVILGQSSLALGAGATTDEERPSWERTLRAARRMERLVVDLLMLARSDARQVEMQTGPIRLRDLMEAVVETVPEEQRAASCLISIISADDLWVSGDVGHLERALHNLLTNALRHTPPAGTVTLSAEAAGETHVVVIVADTGTGISADHVPHVFERFYRADSGRTQRQGGSGLGLAITHSIVTAHDGEIALESLPGSGTTVRIRLPRLFRGS